jgi:hypothetical protein
MVYIKTLSSYLTSPRSLAAQKLLTAKDAKVAQKFAKESLPISCDPLAERNQKVSHRFTTTSS